MASGFRFSPVDASGLVLHLDGRRSEREIAVVPARARVQQEVGEPLSEGLNCEERRVPAREAINCGGVARLGLLAVLRRTFSGVPILRGPMDRSWGETAAPCFPLTFILLSAVLASAVHGLWLVEYSVGVRVDVASAAYDCVWAMPMTFAGCAFLLCAHWLVMAVMIRAYGGMDAVAVRRAGSIVYHAAVWQPLLCTCATVFFRKGAFWGWGPAAYWGSITVFSVVTVAKVLTVMQGMRLELGGRIVPGVVAAAFCPEWWVLVYMVVF